MTDLALQELLQSLSLEEKILQMVQVDLSALDENAGSFTGPDRSVPITPEQIAKVGSLICGGNIKPSVIDKAMASAKEKATHYIPPLIMSDVIHGMRTIFPIPLAQGCTFDEEIVREGAKIAAKEAVASGIHVSFAPMADVARDPRWGRCMESFGESSKLDSSMSAATVVGFHAENLASCAKHFAGYGCVEAGRDYAGVDIGHAELYNVYFPPFKAALDAGCDMIMPAFTPIDRVPAVANHFLLTDTLRDHWHWDGVAISDWASVFELVVHGMCENLKDAAEASVLAGLDMDMVGGAYIAHLQALVDEGKVSMETIDTAVMRILRLKNQLGLFENPLANTSDEVQEQTFLSAEHLEAALKAACKSCVLLKNENGILPLSEHTKVSLEGPFAKTGALLGGWSAGGRVEETPSLWDVFSKQPELTVTTSEEADVILFTCGESQDETGEAKSKVYPVIPEDQIAQLQALAQLGKPVVVLLFCGRPLMVTELLPYANALLQCWFPGSKGAEAIYKLLTGQVNPSGHLSMTMPRAIGQIPIHHDALTNGRPAEHPGDPFRSCYLDESHEPLFPFGFGLSYTSFSIDQFYAGHVGHGMVQLNATVQNTGDHAGETVIQLYHHRKFAAQIMPEKVLTAWQRVYLEPGEYKTLQFSVPYEALTYKDANDEPLPMKGEYRFMIGEDSVHVKDLIIRIND